MAAEDIFGDDTGPNASNQDVVINLDSSDEETDPFELTMTRAANARARDAEDVLERRIASTLASINKDTTKRAAGSQKLSAMIYSREHLTTNVMMPEKSSGSPNVRYLPLCRISSARTNFDPRNHSCLTVLPAYRDRILRSEEGQPYSDARWPLNELPVELFDLITAYLARDDVKSMRLVNHEFEQKVSRSLFHTSVVPFNTELYDMIDEDKKVSSRAPTLGAKGKGKMKQTPQDAPESVSTMDAGGLSWQNAKEDKEGKVYKGHGLRVFQGFGRHIKRFGMSFEVSEKQLSRPPVKKELDHVESYHGMYNWPSAQYARYASLAGLESTADETSRMKAAFSNLEIVQELALSVDSGLGWLNGPDKSVRGRIFERPSPVFGSSYQTPDRAVQAASEFWTALQQSQQSFAPASSLKQVTLEHRTLPKSSTQLTGLNGTNYSNAQLWPSMEQDKVIPPTSSTSVPGHGVLYTTADQLLSTEFTSFRSPLMPAELSKEQKEWLLETQWAQQAFLESYMLAIIDNPRTFEKVTTLNIAKLSSCFLPMMAREVFWDALPALSEVTLHVSPDWRTVEKDDAGLAETRTQSPAEAVRLFYKGILRNQIVSRESIKKLSIGWFSGGEHAEGIFARNTNILPAPITSLEHSTANSSVFGLVFKHVEHLILRNCWITPPALEGLVKSHSAKALKKLTLDSVSLTAHPRFPFPGAAQGGGGQPFAQLMAAAQAQLANIPQGGNPQGAAGVAAMNAQQMQPQWAQQMQQMLANNPNLPNAGLNAQALNWQMAAFNAQAAAMQNGGPPQPLVQPAQAMLNAQNPNPQNVLNAQNPNPQNMLNAQNPNPPAATNTHWTDGHREGSWPQIIDCISPGPVFNDYLPPPPPWEEQPPPRPETNLQHLEFKSCGYAKLPNNPAGFDQFVLEPDLTRAHTMPQWFRARQAGLKSVMMSTSERNMGQIVQYMPQRELDALQFAWGLTEGWEDGSKAEEPEYDGLLPGGTGRFSGTVEKGMSLISQDSGS